MTIFFDDDIMWSMRPSIVEGQWWCQNDEILMVSRWQLYDVIVMVKRICSDYDIILWWEVKISSDCGIELPKYDHILWWMFQWWYSYGIWDYFSNVMTMSRFYGCVGIISGIVLCWNDWTMICLIGVWNGNNLLILS